MCCGGIKEVRANGDDFSQFDELIRDLADEIYLSKNDKTYSPELVKATADKLIDAIKEGFNVVGEDWETTDKAMVDKLIENVFSFSAAKNYQQLHDITSSLIDEKGVLRDFSDFKEAVDKLGYKYNHDWLQTEYDTAIGSATMAARWSEFESEADIFPILEYQTVGDNRVRPAHDLLNGVARRIDDDFWKTYYPPNGWNCRCEAIQRAESDAEESNPPVFLPTVAPMFQTNLAQSGLLFPKDHPYYDGVPKDVLRRAMQYIPQDNAFRTRRGYEEHAMVQHEPEARENRLIAKLLVESGEKDIRLMPRLHEKESDLRVEIYGKEYNKTHPTKCPDAFIKNSAVEFKETKRTNLSKRILQASTQADIAIVKMKEVLTDDYMERVVNGQWKLEDRANLKRIIIISDGKVHKFERPRNAKAEQ